MEPTRRKIRMKFKLHEIRERKVWKEAHEGGVEEGVVTERKSTIQKRLAKGMTHKQVAELLEISVEEVRRMVRNVSR
jgi:DNA-binding NarL/FixJ family response regulator